MYLSHENARLVAWRIGLGHGAQNTIATIQILAFIQSLW